METSRHDLSWTKVIWIFPDSRGSGFLGQHSRWTVRRHPIQPKIRIHADLRTSAHRGRRSPGRSLLDQGNQAHARTGLSLPKEWLEEISTRCRATQDNGQALQPPVLSAVPERRMDQTRKEDFSRVSSISIQKEYARNGSKGDRNSGDAAESAAAAAISMFSLGKGWVIEKWTQGGGRGGEDEEAIDEWILVEETEADIHQADEPDD